MGGESSRSTKRKVHVLTTRVRIIVGDSSGGIMAECECHCHCKEPLGLGQSVPDFETAIYDPVKDDFGTFKLADQKAAKRWTILFFYPADFTFV
jgi:hypothetical protein